MLWRCFMVRLLASRNRSAQLTMQLVSFLSIWPDLMAPVMHLFQQTSVRECMARLKEREMSALVVFVVSLVLDSVFVPPRPSIPHSARGIQDARAYADGYQYADLLDWTRAFWFSLFRKVRSCCLSCSFSFSSSKSESVVPSILLLFCLVGSLSNTVLPFNFSIASR